MFIEKVLPRDSPVRAICIFVLTECDKHIALTGLRDVGAARFYKHIALTGLKRLPPNRLCDEALPKTLLN